MNNNLPYELLRHALEKIIKEPHPMPASTPELKRALVLHFLSGTVWLTNAIQHCKSHEDAYLFIKEMQRVNSIAMETLVL